MNLRYRLLLSYLLVLAVTLGVITLAFVAILGTRPAPPQPTYQRLAAIAQNTDLISLIRRLSQITDPDEQRAAFEAELSTIASNSAVRILLIDLARGIARYDSQQTFSDGEAITVEVDAYNLPSTLQRGAFNQIEAFFGGFSDPDDDQWLMVALVVRRGMGSTALVFADERGQQSLQDALQDFTGALLPLLCQAGAVGAAIAIVLAGIISQTIARPLQAVAQAATGMAGGNYAERVPVTGPSEVRSVAEAFNNMSAQVQSAQQAQQDFLANVSHDLKTPLTSIQGYSQAIVDGAASDPVSAARIIHEEAARLNRMVVELTDLARLQAGRLSMRWSPVDIGLLTKAIAERLSIVAQEKNIALLVDAHPLPEVAGDGDRLAQVLTNLISNAIKYTPNGGQVWVRARLEDGGVMVSVQDNGIGIPSEELPRIFERFYQVDKARGPKRGTGLGLAIASEIVQAHGGRIHAASEGRGKGSTFTLWLPSPQLSTVLRKR